MKSLGSRNVPDAPGTVGGHDVGHVVFGPNKVRHSQCGVEYSKYDGWSGWQWPRRFQISRKLLCCQDKPCDNDPKSQGLRRKAPGVDSGRWWKLAALHSYSGTNLFFVVRSRCCSRLIVVGISSAHDARLSRVWQMDGCCDSLVWD